MVATVSRQVHIPVATECQGFKDGRGCLKCGKALETHITYVPASNERTKAVKYEIPAPEPRGDWELASWIPEFTIRPVSMGAVEGENVRAVNTGAIKLAPEWAQDESPLEPDIEARLNWDRVDHRARAMAGILEVDPEPLTKAVGTQLSKVPVENRYHDARELEQRIWKRLYQQRESIKGNIAVIVTAIVRETQSWFKSYLEYRTLATDGVGQAISLERHMFETEESAGTLDIPDTVDCIDRVHGVIFVKQLLDSLPPLVAEVLKRRLTDCPTTPVERKRLERFLGIPANRAMMYMVLRGENTEPPVWKVGKAGRPKKGVTIS